MKYEDLFCNNEEALKSILIIYFILNKINFINIILFKSYLNFILNNIKGMKVIDIDKVKNEAFDERKEFENTRDNLEEKFHVNNN